MRIAGDTVVSWVAVYDNFSEASTAVETFSANTFGSDLVAYLQADQDFQDANIVVSSASSEAPEVRVDNLEEVIIHKQASCATRSMATMATTALVAGAVAALVRQLI